MLIEKPQGEKIKTLAVDLMPSAEGPAYSYAMTTDGKKYKYITYALSIDDGPLADIFLWSQVWETLRKLCNTPRHYNPAILWREYPSVASAEGRTRIYMRLAIIPEDDLDKILPLEEYTVVENGRRHSADGIVI